SSWAKQGEANRTTAITDKSLLITFPPSYGSDLQLQQAGRYLHFAFSSTDVPIPTENPALLLIINATGRRWSRRAGSALVVVLVILVVLFYLLFGQDSAYFGSRLFFQISGRPSIGFQQFSVFGKQLFEVRTGC